MSAFSWEIKSPGHTWALLLHFCRQVCTDCILLIHTPLCLPGPVLPQSWGQLHWGRWAETQKLEGSRTLPVPKCGSALHCVCLLAHENWMMVVIASPNFRIKWDVALKVHTTALATVTVEQWFTCCSGLSGSCWSRGTLCCPNSRSIPFYLALFYW